MKASQTEIVPTGEVVTPITTTPNTFQPVPSLGAVKLSELLEQYGISGPQVEAKSIIDRPFIITRAKPFASSFKDGVHAYFTTGKDVETGEIFCVVLGGEAVVNMIDALIQVGIQTPIEVTLRFHEGKGKFAGYYTLE